jgi:hypothetical protein
METNDLTAMEKMLFTMMQGFAVGAAMKQRDKRLANEFIRLTNKLNADNPNFTPYQVEEDGEKAQ